MSTSASTKSPSSTSRARRWVRRALLLGGPLLLIAGGLYFYLHGGRVVTTDNAYVHADKLTVAAEVSGPVVEVLVHDNDHVRVGQRLFRLDDEPYRIARDEAAAQVEAVRLELSGLRSSYRQKVAAIQEAQEQLAYAERELRRQQELNLNRVSTEAELDKAQHAVDAAGRRVSVLQQEAATVVASLGGSIETPDTENPRYGAARARLEKAERDLRQTVVCATVDGVVANITNIPVGRYLQTGQAAFSLVASGDIWIEANLKETELTYLRPGNPVEIEIDAYPHRRWRGQVTDINPATGAEFSLIPPQNASGNWVKVVQRIPVRIKIEGGESDCPLRAGMSAEVEIDTGHIRSLRDLTQLFRSGQEG